ncbi:MAG TPA: tripartite tricarboxylate transporter substrate binding protein [Bosea sp. (in: a-proteobacteria)]|nr:tripartite tricarboxylate transporter substrate binding protein [Bosea sp. (in: a-proteobacteria)]
MAARIDRRMLIAGGAGLFGTLVLPRGSQAQDGFPSRPITIVCPYAAGATTDTISRIIAQGLAQELPGSVVVENRAGAGGNIGSAAVANAAPDGHTLLLGAMGPLAINGALYPKLGFDPLKDFAPLAFAASVPLALVVSPKLKLNSLPDLLQALKKEADGTSYASAGSGTPMHLAGELFAKATGTKLVHVAYRGSAPAINDVVAGHVPFMFDALVNVASQVQGGTLKALATTAAERPALFKDVPTLKEAGYDVVVSGWYGFLAPAATPEPIRQKLAVAMARVITRDDVRKKLAELGSDTVDPSPAAFRQLIESETARWQPLVRSLGLKAE